MHCNHLCIVYECLSKNLYELLHATDFQGVSLQLVRDITRQILVSLTFLKSINVIHSDLKPEK
jgi:dual specificity protein kinase YAK1